MSSPPYSVDPAARIEALQRAVEVFALRFKEQADRIEELEERLLIQKENAGRMLTDFVAAANKDAAGAVDRIEALEADFNSAAAAASEYSEFWERHSGDFDQFGNYVPYSQMDGDLRAAKARIEALEAALRLAEEVLSQAPFSTDIWPNGMHPQRGITIIRAALAPEQDK